MISLYISVYLYILENIMKASLLCFDGDVVWQCLDVESDELQSFVGHKANKQWLWLAMDTQSRQVISGHSIA